METVLCDARISRLLLDPHGTVVSLESLTDAITPAQRRAVSIRDRHCIAKGCTRPPAFCDVHHLHHRADGGATSVENLVLLCRRHHVLWHRGTISHHDLHLPWLDLDTEDEPVAHDPWDTHNPPLIA
jgi:5-methylcytosine-specific restriction endonuclease McrA